WLPLVVSFAVAAAIAPATIRSLAAQGMVRENYRGARVAFPAGIAIVVPAFVALIVLAPLFALVDSSVFQLSEVAFTYVIVVALDAHPLWTLGLFVGPILVVMPLDLRELGMLGDTGAGAIGAVAGLWLVLTLSTLGQAIAVGVMLVITVYGEFRSISEFVER